MPTSNQEQSGQSSPLEFFSERRLCSNPLFRCSSPYAQSPEVIGSVLPKLDPRNNTQFCKILETDPIFVSLDFEHLCTVKHERRPNGIHRRYHSVTEVGIAHLDMRDVLYGGGKGIMPGDRGSFWFTFLWLLY